MYICQLINKDLLFFAVVVHSHCLIGYYVLRNGIYFHSLCI